MSLKIDERRKLIEYRLSQSNESIEVVKLLIDNKKYLAAINRIYYGMFYSLLGLALLYGYRTSKHQQLLGWFNKEFIHSDRIVKKYGKMLYRAFSDRTKGDYDIFVRFDEKEVIKSFENMKSFIRRIDKFIWDNQDN